jgi:hypothetical protein
MSLAITVTFDDSVNGTTTDAFSLNDADGATLLSVLSVANAPQPPRPGPNQPPPPPPTPLTYDALYHQIANNFWLGLQARIGNIQLQAAQTTAMQAAQASVTSLSAATQSNTAPAVVAKPGV